MLYANQVLVREDTCIKGLDGKNVLVTGGYRIGMVIAVRFAAEGVNIAIDYRSHPEASEETEAKVVR